MEEVHDILGNMKKDKEEEVKKLLNKIFTKEELMEIVMFALEVDNYPFCQGLVRERIQKKLTEKDKQLENDILKTNITDFPFEERFKVLEMYDKARIKRENIMKCLEMVWYSYKINGKDDRNEK